MSALPDEVNYAWSEFAEWLWRLPNMSSDYLIRVSELTVGPGFWLWLEDADEEIFERQQDVASQVAIVLLVRRAINN